MTMPGFAAEASLYGRDGRYCVATTPFVDTSSVVSPALVGRWTIFGCQVSCIEVCTRLCRPTGWDCCQWETRCAVDWSCLKWTIGF